MLNLDWTAVGGRSSTCRRSKRERLRTKITYPLRAQSGASLDDIIRSKTAAGRNKNAEALLGLPRLAAAADDSG